MSLDVGRSVDISRPTPEFALFPSRPLLSFDNPIPSRRIKFPSPTLSHPPSVIPVLSLRPSKLPTDPFPWTALEVLIDLGSIPTVLALGRNNDANLNPPANSPILLSD